MDKQTTPNLSKEIAMSDFAFSVTYLASGDHTFQVFSSLRKARSFAKSVARFATNIRVYRGCPGGEFLEAL